MMRDFAMSQSERRRDVLLDAIHGRGAFRCFSRELERLCMVDAWDAHREKRFEQMAIEWLEEHGLEWHRAR